MPKRVILILKHQKMRKKLKIFFNFRKRLSFDTGNVTDYNFSQIYLFCSLLNELKKLNTETIKGSNAHKYCTGRLHKGKGPLLFFFALILLNCQNVPKTQT